MEQADAHAVPAEHLDETDLSLVKLPTRSDEAAVLIGIGIGEHYLLFSALRIDQLAILGNRQETVHQPDAGAQILDRLKEGHERERRRPGCRVDETDLLHQERSEEHT